MCVFQRSSPPEGRRLSQGQEPTYFIYDILKIHKKLGLGISEDALVNHIFVRLEPQIQDYIEVRNPKTTAQLLEVMAKFEERYPYKEMQGSGNSDNVGRRGWNKLRMSNDDIRQRNWRDAEVIHRTSDRRNNYRGNYEIGPQWSHRDRWFENGNRVNTVNQRFNAKTRGNFSREGQRNRGPSGKFSRGLQKNTCLSEKFSRGDRRQGGLFNVLKVRDDQKDQS
ncbi:uncharacterized protein TNCV_2729931 [Trichonephila clavipes]|nr:uncharacterized protein TNCV_2729931 [Trichonephila clavipes]